MATKIEDSNLAFIGSAEDKAAKLVRMTRDGIEHWHEMAGLDLGSVDSIA